MSDQFKRPDPQLAAARLQQALGDPGLHSDNQEEAARAACDLAVAVGHCLLFAGSSAEAASLPDNLALPAAEGLTLRLRQWTAIARELAQRADETDDLDEQRDLSLRLLQARLDAWGAFLAIDNSWAAAWARGGVSADLTRRLDEIIALTDDLDRELRQQTTFLALACQTDFLESCRQALAEPYRVPLPWWLAGSLERAERALAADANAKDVVLAFRHRVLPAPLATKDDWLPVLIMGRANTPQPPSLPPLRWRSPSGKHRATMSRPAEVTSDSVELVLKVRADNGSPSLDLEGHPVRFGNVPRTIEGGKARFPITELRGQDDELIIDGQRWEQE